MGNHFGSSSSRPESSTVVHPTLVGRLPPPQPLATIEPELMLYTAAASGGGEAQSNTAAENPCLLINISHSPEEAVRMIGQHLNGNANREETKRQQQQKPQRLIILTHGFLSTKQVSWLHQLKDAILASKSEKYHRQLVMILGWGGGANIGLRQYPQAAANGLEVGRWLGAILRELRQVYPVADGSSGSGPGGLATYAVGHSLGAHLLGAAGRSCGGALDRITGLDPAGVGFQTAENAEHRLGPGDARLLVDVIHTDGQDVPYFGTLLPMGTLDFYPNYGWNQPTKDRVRDLKPDQISPSETVVLVVEDSNNNNSNNQKRHRKVALPSPYGDQISESHSRAIELFTWSVGNGRAFRSAHRLEGRPGVESAVHRVVTTGRNGTAEVSVEMGYHADQYMDGLLEDMAAKDKDTNQGNDNEESGADKDAGKYAHFAGCYYVHTNATPPWS